MNLMTYTKSLLARKWFSIFYPTRMAHKVYSSCHLFGRGAAETSGFWKRAKININRE